MYLCLLTELRCRNPLEHFEHCSLTLEFAVIASLVAKSLPVNLVVWKAGCAQRLSEEMPSSARGQAKFSLLRIAVATRTADVCTADKQH